MNMPILDNTYDAVYTIEASCHAPDPVSNLTLTKLCSSVVSSEWTGLLAHMTITSLGFIFFCVFFVSRLVMTTMCLQILGCLLHRNQEGFETWAAVCWLRVVHD